MLPLDIATFIRSGSTAPVPLMLGRAREELYLPPDADHSDIGEAAVMKKLIWKFSDNAPLVMDRHRAWRQGEDYAAAYGATATEYTYVQAYLRTAELLLNAGYPLWLYRWDYQGG